MKQYTTEISLAFVTTYSKEFDAHSLPSPTPINLIPRKNNRRNRSTSTYASGYIKQHFIP